MSSLARILTAVLAAVAVAGAAAVYVARQGPPAEAGATLPPAPAPRSQPATFDLSAVDATANCWSARGSLEIHFYGSSWGACGEWNRLQSGPNAFWQPTDSPQTEPSTRCTLGKGSLVIEVVVGEARNLMAPNDAATAICGDLLHRGWEETPPPS
jgi:hypothetical protein